MVVCVECGREDIAMKLILRRDLAKGKHWSVILDDDLVGTLCCRDENGKGLTLCVSALNLSTMKEVLIATDVPSSVSTSESYILFFTFSPCTLI